MPRANREGFDENETVDQSLSETSASEAPSEPATPPRRRRGRRVTREVGAAGATVALQVQDHSMPLFEEPHLPSRQESKPEPAPSHDEEEQVAPRRRSRRAAGTAERRGTERVFQSPFDDPSGDARALDAVESLPEGHESRHHPRPMTSLLFQEPVLPELRPRPVERDDDEREEDDDERPASRRTRSRRARNREDERDARRDEAEEREEDEPRLSRRRRSRSREVGPDTPRGPDVPRAE